VRLLSLIAAMAVAAAGLGFAAGAGAGASGRRAGAAGHRAGALRHRSGERRGGGAFVSVWPVRGAKGQRVIERFSLRSGRPRGVLYGRLPATADVSAPMADRRGAIWFTESSGPRCSLVRSIDCGPPAPRTCASRVIERSPSGAARTALSYSPNELVTGAAPDPVGDEIALVQATSCTASYFDDHYVVRSLRSGASWSIGADARPCHFLSTPAWNAAGTVLVFAFGASSLKAGERQPVGAGGPSCPQPRPANIVLAPAGHASRTSSWTVIAHHVGCEYESAAFDRTGIAAFEACAPRHRPGPANDFIGPAYVVQLAVSGRVEFRVRLAVGANPGSVASDPSTGEVLVSQNQTYRPHRPTHNFVWQLSGDRLRLVGRYPFTGEGVFAAAPL
jgi:hypothetical protein